MYSSIAALITAVAVASAIPTEQQFCVNLNPQNSLDIGQIMGMWYGVELIPHVREDEGIRLHDSCPIIHLTDITYERTTTENHLMPGDYGYQWSRGLGTLDWRDREYRFLRLYWDENGNGLEYTLKYNNTRRGFWVSGTPKYGEGAHNYDAIDWIANFLEQQDRHERANLGVPYTLNTRRPPKAYRGVPQAGGYGYGDLQYMSDRDRVGVRTDRKFTFAGIVQVMKAVSNQLVLTFCQRVPDSQLFTIILAREPNQLTTAEIHSVHNLLNRRDLSTSSIKKVCTAGANSLVLNFITYLMSCSFTFFALGRL